jgi:hypothetical protein
MFQNLIDWLLGAAGRASRLDLDQPTARQEPVQPPDLRVIQGGRNANATRPIPNPVRRAG